MILVLPPHVAGKNIQFSAIFRDCAACDRDSALAQNLDNLLVAQRRIALFAFHQVQNPFFDAGIAHRFTGGGLITRREEIFHLKHALRRGDVFPRDRAADRGLVHAHRVGDLHHGHRLQMGRSVLEKIALPLHDLVRDIGNRLLALVDRLDQKFAAPDFIANVIFDFVAIAILRHDVFVSVADAQVWDLLAV